MERLLKKPILQDLNNKIVLLSGPRQTGKTTLAKQLFPEFDYLNYDSGEDRVLLHKKMWDRKKPLVIFDELHKKKDWKRWLKGIYDTEKIPPRLLVTGSAKLDIHRRVGDSLAGRHFQFRMHPLDLKEAKKILSFSAEEIFSRLWHCSGFPEPFLSGKETFYRRWRRTHLNIILQQDLKDLHTLSDIKSIETLVLLLRDRVGSTVSYANLARDLERDATTIKRWIQLLENLYIVFRVTPYHKNIARSLLKESKYYFYDFAFVNNEAARLENLVACALLKELHFLEDTEGFDTALHFVRTKEGKEIDFLINIDNKPHSLIEVKSSDHEPAHGFKHFQSYLKDIHLIQLVHHLKRETTHPSGVEVRALIAWLAQLDLNPKEKSWQS